MADKSVVLAFFGDEVAADDAVEKLKDWEAFGKDDVKLNAIGVLVLDDKGKIKTHKLGKRSVGTGAGIGLLLAVIAPPTLLAGVIGGGLLGAFHHKGLGLKSEDRDRIAAQLAGGKAAVGVLVKEDQTSRGLREACRAGRGPRVLRDPRGGRRRGRGGCPCRRGGRGGAGDDLTLIDGIGPVISDTLRAAGVTTFAQVAAMAPEAIEEILATANLPEFAGQNASTWPRQAKLAAAGDWAGAAPLHRLHEEVAVDEASAGGIAGSRDRRAPGPRDRRRVGANRKSGAALLGEALGTLLFAFTGVECIVLGGLTGTPSDLIGVALAHAITLAVVVTMSAAISGVRINPAVTVGLG